MSNLVTITSAFYDRSGKRLKNLSVKSRYKRSSRENLSKTDSSGLFIFQASPDRAIEILAKPPNAKDYTVFKTVNSSTESSSLNPIKIVLPKTIEEYKWVGRLGLVSNIFKVVDVSGKVMPNFPVQTRPKGGKSFERTTDENGLVEVQSSPEREIEFLVLATSDKFLLKESMNSGSGSAQAIIVQLNEPYSKFVSHSEVLIVDRDENIYTNKNTNVEMEVLSTGLKKIYNISNGRLPVTSMVGQKLKFTVLKPDGKPLDSTLYVAKRIEEKSLKLKLDVDVTKNSTAKNEPRLDINIDEKILITMDQMQKMWPQANVQKMQPILDEINSDLKGYKLDTRLRQAHFMAQVFAECGPYFSLRENIGSYTEKNLLDNMGYYKRKPNEAKNDAVIKDRVLKEKTICNKAYMDKNRAKNRALGNVNEGDGYRFIGRGLKMTTGRYNYTQFNIIYKKAWPDEQLDFVDKPELVEQPKYAVRTALVYWFVNKLYQKADVGTSHEVVDSITRGVNAGATIAMINSRRSFFDTAKNIFR